MTSSPTAKLKIGFVFDDSLDNPDGVQQYITTLGNWLKSQGHHVRYIVGETKTAADHQDIHSISHNLHVRFNKNRMSIPLPTSRERIRHLLQLEKFDVLHVQLPCSPWMAGRVVSLADPTTVIVGTFHIFGHHWLVNHGAKLLGLLQQRMHQRFDHIVCVSRPAQEFAERQFDIEGSTILPNVVDLDRFQQGRPIAHFDDKKTTIVFLGRLVERKGCRYLIEAIRRLRDRQAADNLRVLICGKGPLEAQLKQLVRRYELQEIISFTGFVDEADKANYLATADLAIFPSTGGESFGIVLCEAMAANAGVVMGGDNVGYRTVLGEQANHVLFTPANTQVFADKIQLLLANPKLRQQLHTWQQQAVRQYDVSVVGPKLVELYQQPSVVKNT